MTISPRFYYEGGGGYGDTAGHGSSGSFSVGSSKTSAVTVTGTYVSGPTVTRFDTRYWSPYSSSPDYKCYTLGMQATSNQQVYQGTHKICYEISTDRTNWNIVSLSSYYVIQYTGNVGEYIDGLNMPDSINSQQAAGKTLYMRACDVLDGVKSTSYTAIKSITLGTPLDTPVLNSCTRVSSSQLAVSYEKVPNAKLYIIEYSRNRTFTDKKIITV